jgi:cysteine desulfurase
MSSFIGNSSGKVKKSHVLKAMGMAEQDIESAVRVSFGPHNTLAEANAFVKSWSKIYQELG